MPKYLLEVSYTLEGVRGLRTADGSARVAAVTAATEAAGGTIEAFYFAFDDKDACLIVDYPDAVTAPGGARVPTVSLLTPAGVDSSVRRSPRTDRLGADFSPAATFHTLSGASPSSLKAARDERASGEGWRPLQNTIAGTDGHLSRQVHVGPPFTRSKVPAITTDYVRDGPCERV
jgi:hypothetical protein